LLYPSGAAAGDGFVLDPVADDTDRGNIVTPSGWTDFVGATNHTQPTLIVHATAETGPSSPVGKLYLPVVLIVRGLHEEERAASHDHACGHDRAVFRSRW
jgi:hypothetical protein